MTRWCCQQLDLGVRQVKRARFGNRETNDWSGWAYFYKREILVRVRKDEFLKPLTNTRFGRTVTLHDRIEILVMLTAHELTHIRQYSEGKKGKLERECDREMAHVLEIFRGQREQLLTEWDVAPKPKKPQPSLVEKRQAHAVAMLAKWDTKLKSAKAYRRKWADKVRYYEKAAASKGGKT